MADARLLKHYRFISFDPKKDIPSRKVNEVVRRFERVGVLLFKAMFVAEVGGKLPEEFNAKHIAENVFFTTMIDLDKKLKRREYYICNAQLFLRYVPEICEADRNVVNPFEGDINDYITESYALLQRHSWYISKNNFEYGLWKTDHTQYYRLFSTSNKLIRNLPVANADLGAATLRLCIENRIRLAIRHKIEIAVDICLIERIYKWTNHFIHASHSTFPWLVRFAHDILHPLFWYASHNGQMGIMNSIRMSVETHREIRASILEFYARKDPNSSIHGYRAEDCYYTPIDVTTPPPAL